MNRSLDCEITHEEKGNVYNIEGGRAKGKFNFEYVGIRGRVILEETFLC